MNLTQGNKMQINNERDNVIVCFGDSITECNGFEIEQKWTSCLEKDLNQEQTAQYKVYNCGIGGETTALALERIYRDIVPLCPATILIEFGFNDAYVMPSSQSHRVDIVEYERNLNTIVGILEDSKGKVILIRNHTNCCKHAQGNKKHFLENFAPYDKLLCEICAHSELPMIDLPLLMKNANITGEDMVSDDGLHLSVNGNLFYAELVCKELKKIIKL